jgi:hypothetical protein
MANFAQIITQAGTYLQTQALGNGEVVQFVSAYIGDGVPGASDDKTAYTSLINQTLQANIGVASFVNDDAGSHTDIPVQVTNQGISVPYYVREIGVFAKVGTGLPVLYTYLWLTDTGDNGDNTLLPPPSGVDYNVVRNYVASCFIGQLDVTRVTINTSPATMIRFDQMQSFVSQQVVPLQTQVEALEAIVIPADAPVDSQTPSSSRPTWTNVQAFLTGLWSSLKSFFGYSPSSFATSAQGAKADAALPATSKAADSALLNGQNAAYYLNYTNATNKPTIPTVPAYSTSTTLAAGTASAGTANTIARGDHRHPNPTSTSASITSGSGSGILIPSGTIGLYFRKNGNIVCVTGWIRMPTSGISTNTYVVDYLDTTGGYLSFDIPSGYTPVNRQTLFVTTLTGKHAGIVFGTSSETYNPSSIFWGMTKSATGSNVLPSNGEYAYINLTYAAA